MMSIIVHRLSSIVRRLPAPLTRHYLPPHQAKEHFVARACVFGVQFDPRALEVLHGVSLAVGLTDLLDRLGERVAEVGQTVVGLPVVANLARDGMPGLREEGCTGRHPR